MNASVFKQAEVIIGKSYADHSKSARKRRERLVQALISNRRLPPEPWDQATIELFLAEMAGMDSNNYFDYVGVGEREGRVFSEMVRKRSFGLSHGIGRSGDIAAIQPKAAGSSLLNKLTNHLMLSLLRLHIKSTASSIILPMATGMALFFAMRTLQDSRKKATKIIWPRIDQKTCLKSQITLGLETIIIENILEGDECRTDLKAIEDAITRYGGINGEEILCILTTSSCFAPRAPDRLNEVAKICKLKGIPHLINNAYGVQCPVTCRTIQKAHQVGRVDAYVQSTDKNFMVPVGGSVVASFDKKFCDKLAKLYPGRASISPILDVFCTLISMGEKKWRRLQKEREEMYPFFKSRLKEVADAVGERLLETPTNPISLGMTLSNLGEGKSVSKVGSMCFTRAVSGIRTVPQGLSKVIGNYSFVGWGSHHNEYPHSYLTVACAIGMKKRDIVGFTDRLLTSLTKLKRLREDKKLEDVEEGKISEVSTGEPGEKEMAPDKEKPVE